MTVSSPFVSAFASHCARRTSASSPVGKAVKKWWSPWSVALTVVVVFAATATPGAPSSASQSLKTVGTGTPRRKEIDEAARHAVPGTHDSPPVFVSVPSTR